jgi:hypothetical protein
MCPSRSPFSGEDTKAYEGHAPETNREGNFDHDVFSGRSQEGVRKSDKEVAGFGVLANP